jgi:hypothetical protein
MRADAMRADESDSVEALVASESGDDARPLQKAPLAHVFAAGMDAFTRFLVGVSTLQAALADTRVVSAAWREIKRRFMMDHVNELTQVLTKIGPRDVMRDAYATSQQFLHSVGHTNAVDLGIEGYREAMQGVDGASAGVEAAELEVELGMERAKSRSLEEKLATEREKIRELKERLRVAAETGEVSMFPGLKRGCVNGASISTASSVDIMATLEKAVVFNPLDESGKPTIALKQRRDSEALIIALCAVGISTCGFPLSNKLTSHQTKLVIDNANVIIDAVAKKIDGFPLAFDNADDLKARVAAKILQKDLIGNTKKRGQNVWEGNVPPQNAPLMMHEKQKEALKEFGFPFDKTENRLHP